MGGVSLGTTPEDSRGGGGDSEMDDLIGPQNVSGCYTGTRGADIEGFRKLDEFRPRCVSCPQENRHLQANARRSSSVSGIHALTILQKTSVHRYFA